MPADHTHGASDRSFGFTFAAVFALLSALALWRGSGHWAWFITAAALCCAVALTHPSWLAPLNRLWTKFGLLLHHITSPIVLTVMFFVAITPVGLVMRLRGKDGLARAYDTNAKSYWIPRIPPGPPPESMQQQF